jgi:hypothetical protein
VVIARLKEMHGVRRAGPDVQNNVFAGVDRARSGRLIELDDANFLRVPAQHVSHFRVPTGRQEPRDIDHIPVEEIRLAVLHVVEAQFGMPRDAVPREAAKALGYRYTSAAISDAIAEQVDQLVEDGLLRASGFQVSLA